MLSAVWIWEWYTAAAGDPPSATNFFQTGGVSAIVSAIVLGAYALYKQMASSQLDRRKVTSDEFAEHRAFYEREIARLETRALSAERDAMQARQDASSARNEQQEMRTEIRELRREITKLRTQLGGTDA